MKIEYEDDIYHLSVDEAEMQAQLTLAPEDEKYEYNYASVLEFLKQHNVRMGVDQDKLKLMVENRQYFVPVVVANGKPSVDGNNGFFTYHFDTSMSVKPEVKEDGSVDFLNTRLFEEAKPGDLLAEYTPATMGDFGFTVTGRFLTPKKGRELSKLKGRGFEISEDGRMYCANKQGRIEYKYGELNVLDVYDFHGDLDMSQSHIRFSGDVCVHGDVATGMIIEAQGNVEIDGHVAGATIRAGKDIILKKGAQGAKRAHFEAKGNIFGQFFEECSLITDGDIVANYLLNCDSYAVGTINIKGKKGVILGGNTQGVLGVEVSDVGNIKEVPTTIQIGVGDKIVRQYSEIVESIKGLDNELALMDKGLAKLSVLKEMVDNPEYEASYKKLFQAKIIKNAEKNQNLEKRKTIFTLMNDAGKATLSVHGTAYPGVSISFGDVKKVIRTKYMNTVFEMVDNDVAIQPLD
jgi:hypothetical protein